MSAVAITLDEFIAADRAQQAQARREAEIAKLAPTPALVASIIAQRDVAYLIAVRP